MPFSAACVEAIWSRGFGASPDERGNFLKLSESPLNQNTNWTSRTLGTIISTCPKPNARFLNGNQTGYAFASRVEKSNKS